MKLEAPAGRGDYVVGAKDQAAAVKVKRRCWYLFWGLLPVSKAKTSSADVVQHLPPGYKIIKAETSLDAASVFVSLFTAGLVGASVIVVEGIAVPMPPQPPAAAPPPPPAPAAAPGGGTSGQ